MNFTQVRMRASEAGSSDVIQPINQPFTDPFHTLESTK